MSRRLRWIVTVVAFLVGSGIPPCESAPAKERLPESGIPLQVILELEHTARLLAILLDSGRSVINENQALFDDPGKIEKGFTPDVFERQVADMFRARSGIDLAELESARVPDSAKKWLKELVVVSKQVVQDAQSEINRATDGSKFIPAVFGSRVAARFTERTGVRMKQTTLAPRNPANAPDSVERASLEIFAHPDYPREKVISEITAKSGMLRLMFPLYMTRQCLDCHGEPKGMRDKTGYPREGLKLGQNAGAISIVIPISK